MISPFLFLLCSIAVSANIIQKVDQSNCGSWSEWTGDCEHDRCGLCNIQERVREITPGCKGKAKELRHCVNAICNYPCYSCAAGCHTDVRPWHTCKANNTDTVADMSPWHLKAIKMKKCRRENNMNVHY